MCCIKATAFFGVYLSTLRTCQIQISPKWLFTNKNYASQPVFSMKSTQLWQLFLFETPSNTTKLVLLSWDLVWTVMSWFHFCRWVFRILLPILMNINKIWLNIEKNICGKKISYWKGSVFIFRWIIHSVKCAYDLNNLIHLGVKEQQGILLKRNPLKTSNTTWNFVAKKPLTFS